METGMITQNIGSTIPLSHHSNNQENTNVEKIKKGSSAVLYKEKDAALVSLSFNDSSKKSNMYESISKINNIFAISQISQKGLERQEEILTKMENIITSDSQIKDETTKKNELISLVKDFNQSIQNTKYNNEMLLTTQKSFDEITFSTRNDTYFLQTPDMESSLQTFAKLSVGYSDTAQYNEGFLKEIKSSLDNIAQYSKNYENIQKTIQQNPLESMVSNLDSSSVVANTLFMDFGRNMNDFNKTNITSQLGYLAAAQANILQEQSSRLLV